MSLSSVDPTSLKDLPLAIDTDSGGKYLTLQRAYAGVAERQTQSTQNRSPEKGMWVRLPPPAPHLS
jgi:hypothetical protein